MNGAQRWRLRRTVDTNRQLKIVRHAVDTG
jgi:hypothetical protein